MKPLLSPTSMWVALGALVLVVAAGCNDGGGDQPPPVTGGPLPGLPAAASKTLNITVRNSSGRTAYVRFTGDAMDVAPANDVIPDGDAHVFAVNNIVAGRIYISYGKALATDAPDGANANDADFNTRFDKVELTYHFDAARNHGAGKMNLTAVDHFAIPLELDTWIENVRIEHFSLAEGQTALTLVSALKDVAGASAIVANNGETTRILSPVKKPGAYKGFDGLLNALDGTTFTISGQFFGTPTRTYNYSGKMANGLITLSDGSDTLTIAKSSLMWDPSDAVNHNGIYTSNGAYTVNGATHHVSDNDRYAAVYRDLVTGFNLGFVKTGSNDSSAWWSKTAFQSTPFNEYAKVIAERYSGAYSFPFTDRYQHILADLGRGESKGVWGGIDGVTVNILDDKTGSTPYRYNGNENPQSGVTTFNLSINAGKGNEAVFPTTPFLFNAQPYVGGKAYKWPTEETQWSPGHDKSSVDISFIPAAEGLNLYHLEFGWRQYLVLVKIVGGKWQWGAVAGGGNSNWDLAADGTPLLYVGGVLD